ncbi:hypothetical protein [Aquimarina sp. AU119]|uniref:hypothetical protein n=1 Tax=Aquimarina sp. AU119 TaxID=2108528 RepID=UPI000D696496|nr:hypothetical protein [Aquimarina sp. AU119]
MKQKYLLGYSFIALFLIFASCSKDENEIVENGIVESEKVTLEPDFIENDGSEGIEDEVQLEEEEAPSLTENNSKTYGHRRYKLLTPSDVTPADLEACGQTTTMPLLVGSRKIEVGNVNVSNDEENLYLTFKANSNYLMKKVYLYIGAKQNIPFYSNGFPNLRKFNYKAFPYYFGGMKEATYVIPLSSIELDCFEIVAYSKIYSKKSNCFYTSFAYDQTLDQEYTYYNHYYGCVYYGDWIRSFEYCKQTCKADCTEVYGYHEDCGICENGNLNTFFAYSFLDRRGEAGVDVELITSPEGCDITNSEEVGHINISSISETKLKIEYQLSTGYEMCELSFSYGISRFNTPNNYSQQFDTPTTSYSFEIDKLTGANIYLDSKAQITTSN